MKIYRIRASFLFFIEKLNMYL